MAKLTSYQKRWIDDTSPVKVWEKSRRIGASWCDAADSALVAAKAKEDGGMSTYYLSYNKDMTKQYVSDVADWAKKFNLVAGGMEEIVLANEDKDITIFQVRFASGFVVQGLSSNPANLRSKQGRVRIDEAGFVENLRELLKAALALIMWGGDIAIISTHNGDESEFNEIVEDIRAGKLNYSLHRTTLDDALEEGLYKAICQAKKQDWNREKEKAWREGLLADYGDGADEELFCIPARSGGAYLVRTTIEGCMDQSIPVIRWQPPAKDFVDWSDEQRHREMQEWLDENLRPILASLPEKHSWIGEDFGRDVDLTDIWPLQEAPGLTYRTPFLLELRDCPFSQQEQALFYVCHGLPLFSGGALDKGGNGAFLAERARQEFGPEIIEQVHFSENWNLENWPPAKAALEDRTVLIPKDDNVLDDLRAVKVVKGVPKIPRDARTKDRKDAGKRHGDSAIAYALAFFAARKFDATFGDWDFCTGGAGRTAGIMRGY
jgi:phage FluMu gp28-like protein